MRLLALILCLCMATGCSRKPRMPDVAPEAVIGATEWPEDLDHAYEQLAQKEAEVGALERYILGMEKQADAARLQRLKTLSYWVAGLALLAALGCVGAAIWLGIKTLWTAAIACAAISALAVAFAWLVSYLIWIGLALGFVITGLALWSMYKRKQAAELAVRYGVDAAKRLSLDERKALDSQHRKEQGHAGVHGFLHQMVREVKDGQ